MYCAPRRFQPCVDQVSCLRTCCQRGERIDQRGAQKAERERRRKVSLGCCWKHPGSYTCSTPHSVLNTLRIQGDWRCCRNLSNQLISPTTQIFLLLCILCTVPSGVRGHINWQEQVTSDNYAEPLCFLFSAGLTCQQQGGTKCGGDVGCKPECAVWSGPRSATWEKAQEKGPGANKAEI